MDGAPQTPVAEVAQSGRALNIERVFTTPGTHPFDMVEWELRDARIGHGDRVAFEQLGVEFPKSWSQNATNIVAQKYFRGQIGAPERESSVKEMISRVAGTITGWGRAGGYFAEEDDARAFNHELAHILLNQLAAFNSPVWFNVGFEESPQCSACLPHHALVSTPAGMIPIGEIVENEQVGLEVYDSQGTTRVVAVKDNGRKPVWRVKLRNGSFVEATADHVVKAVAQRRTQPQWLRVDQLRPGMRMHLHPHRSKVADPVRVAVGAGGIDTAFELLDETDRVAVAEAALAGWLQADGFVGQYASGTNRSLTIEFQVATDDEFDWIIENLDVAFPDVHRKVREADTQTIRVRRIRLYGEALREFVERWGLLARGTEMRVPQRLFTSSHDEIAAYLRSLFQADGYVSVRRDGSYENARVAFAVIGERWTEDVQLLLGTLGIYSRRARKHERRDDRHDLHEVAISIGSERARFAELIGFIGHGKQDKLLQSLALRNPKHCPDLREEEIVSIECLGEMHVYDIQTESNEFLTNNVAVHNCFILSVEDTMESILDWNTKEGMIFRGGSGSGINLSNIRGSMEPLAKGGTASGPVSFMRGADSWAGTIKSGGKTRRAAKMVVLDVDHPDIREFIWCKAKEEDKAEALRDAGFDMSIDGEGFKSIQYQNANNSVRVTDEFMRAVEEDREWRLTARTTGEPVGEPIPARELMREIAEAAWRCADPGVQYDTTINQWHTSPNSGRINASNPCCFVGETVVKTTLGDWTFDELYGMSVEGVQLPMVEAFDTESNERVARDVAKVWVAGMASRLSTVELADGSVIRCTPEHRFLTASGEWLAAAKLVAGIRLQATVDRAESNAPYAVKALTTLAVRRVTTDDLLEPVPVFDMEVEGLHNFVLATAEDATGVVVHNSEYMHVDNSACNLASLNLMKFRRPDGTLDVASFEHTVDIMLLAQEIIVGPSSYPTEEIGHNARAFRQLGLGYANLGAYLMSNGMPYDSDHGRGAAAAITALMTGRAYRRSAEVAGALGPYERYEENREPHNNVMRMHRDASYAIPDAACVDGDLLAAARRSWDEAVGLGERSGYRNAQATVLAPTGTISFLMDCDTTGVEPDFSLVKFKELVGGGQMTIVNKTVPLALQTLGYSEQQVEQIEAHLAEHGTIVGAPGLNEEHLAVFDVAVGERAISHMGHLQMMGAVQPFISGAISKCVSGETLVASEHGLVRISSLHSGEQPDSFRNMELAIASLDGTRNTNAFYYGGTRPVREVRLRSGHRVTGTPNHRLLTCGPDGLAWRRLDELQVGEYVATQYGDDLWATAPASFAEFTPSASYGSQKTVTIPEEMDSRLAFFLGAYAAEGHISRSTWTVKISNADETVIPLIVDAAQGAFGFSPKVVRHADKCPSIELSSKRVVEFLDYLGCGDRASNKRVPDAILRSPRAMVLRFLDGLCLDAYITIGGTAKWAICLDSDGLLDDLQAILTNLGIVHSRITKQAPLYEKTFDEVYTAGREAQRLVAMLDFVEPHKALRASELRAREFSQSPWDIVPGIRGQELYGLLPLGRSGRLGNGSGISRTFSYLKDERTQSVSRTSVERVATIEGVQLPEWLDVVLERNLHFSPVVSVEDAGERAVYDVSVPVTHAFVANGIVNHNTVNLPQEATVEDIADAYTQAWRLGVKALAIYRDGSKTAQALRTDAQQGVKETVDVDAIVEQAVSKALAEVGPRRKRMPVERQSITHKFSIAGHEGYITAGMYDDGSVGEIFLTDIGKEGSTLRGMMNSFATAISIALQYGVPLETLVQKFSYMRFEPEGITGNPEIPFAKSMPDYIMRWLASRFLDVDAQEELGILTPAVRARKIAQETTQSVSSSDTAGPASSDGAGPGNGNGGGSPSASPQPGTSSQASAGSSSGQGTPAAASLTDSPPVVPARLQGLDLGPACSQCGGMMQRTGSCYTCSSCGNNTGCG